MLLIILLALALAYLGAFYLRRPRPEYASWGVALLSSVAVIAVVAASPHWRESTEIAWIGLQSVEPGDPLQIGGSGDAVATGWPNGAFTPALRIRAGQLEITGGGGFIKAPNGDFLNGQLLKLNEPLKIDDFVVEVQRRWYFLRQLSIRRAQKNEELASFPLRRSGRDRVLPMEPAIEPDAVRLRAARQAAKAAELDRWADGMRLLIPRRGDFRIAGRAEVATAKLELPIRLTVVWREESQPLEIRTDPAGRMTADFLPPWRDTSPLPPPPAAGAPASLTLTAQPRPGDRAFRLPLGPALSGFQASLEFAGDRLADCASDRPATGRYGIPRAAPGEPSPWAGLTCLKAVPAGKVAFRMATVRDVPRVTQAALLIGIALLALALGLWTTMPRMRERDRWVICGLATSIWLILIYRCLLALRYASDPAYLDPLAVKGVTTAMIALVVAPALVLLVAPLWRDQYLDLSQFGGGPTFWRRSRAPRPPTGSAVARSLVAYGLLVTAAAIFQALRVRSLWPNIPGYYSPAGSWPGFLTLVAGAAALFGLFALVIVFGYLLDLRGLKLKPGLERVAGALNTAVISSMHLARNAAIRIGPDLWRTVEPAAQEGPQRAIGVKPDRISQPAFWRGYRALTVSAAAVLLGLYFLLGWRVSGAQKYVQEIVAPLVMCWIPACLMLGARKVFDPGAATPLDGRRAAVLVLTIMLFSVFAFPIAVHDVGGVVATLAVFAPVAILLWLGGRPNSIRWAPAGLLLAVVLAAGLLYVKGEVELGPLRAIGHTGGARILAWKEGAKLPELLLWSQAGQGDDAPLPVSQRRLTDSMEHYWENKLMAHEGGWLGLGFGNAPTRLSHIRQDTLQYDSTFSFFVLGEQGWIGGLCLLLLYAVPLALVLISAREFFDVGHGVAVVVSGAFLLAALAHAGMNLGALPFTGRNLPLLSVNSVSDLVLWTLLICLAVQALLWRVTGDDRIYADPDSLISPGPPSGPEPAGAFRRACLVIAGLPALLLVWFGAAGALVVRDRALAGGFDWSGLLAGVNDMIAMKRLSFDKQTMTIRAGIPVSPDTLLGQEIERFNALTEDERMEGVLPHGPKDFRARLRAVRSLADYDKLLAALRALDDRRRSWRRPSLFEVSPPEEWADVDATVRFFDPDYRLSANPAFNTSVSFRTGSREEDFPAAGLREGVAGGYVLRGPRFELFIPNRPARPQDDSVVTLLQNRNIVTLVGDASQAAPRFRLFLRYHPTGRAAAQTLMLGRGEVQSNGLYFASEKIRLEVLRQGRLPASALKPGQVVRLDPGDQVQTAGALASDFQPSFRLERSSRGALLGAAWVKGNWVQAYDPDPLVPWTRHLQSALLAEWRVLGVEEAKRKYGTLSLDRGLQQAAQEFTAEKGRLRHGQLLAARGSREALPPRIALAILDLPSGEALALGGWPRMSSGPHWIQGDVPSVEWVEGGAPRSLRRRYAGDRNFDRMIMGSATKPILASAGLAYQKKLDELLRVSGGPADEDQLFGLRITDHPWHVGGSAALGGGRWADFTSYLARSDNRYHLRFGFLSVAQPGPQYTIQPGAASASGLESLDGGKTEWRRFPKFPDELLFSPESPRKIRGLENTEFARRLWGMYRIGVRRGDILRRYSFWTGDEADDVTPSRPLFGAISPEAPQFALDRLEDPRHFVSLLLGGDENLWANADFAAAFATCIQGYPVTAHITRSRPAKSPREEFAVVARKMRPGLQAVIEHASGTAHAPLARTGALQFIHGLGYHAYAKTGTLAEGENQPSTSRLVLALVRWDAAGKISNGLAFSLVVERGHMALASEWLGEFLVRNAAQIRAGLR